MNEATTGEQVITPEEETTSKYQNFIRSLDSLSPKNVLQRLPDLLLNTQQIFQNSKSEIHNKLNAKKDQLTSELREFIGTHLDKALNTISNIPNYIHESAVKYVDNIAQDKKKKRQATKNRKNPINDTLTGLIEGIAQKTTYGKTLTKNEARLILTYNSLSLLTMLDKTPQKLKNILRDALPMLYEKLPEHYRNVSPLPTKA